MLWFPLGEWLGSDDTSGEDGAIGSDRGATGSADSDGAPAGAELDSGGSLTSAERVVNMDMPSPVAATAAATPTTENMRNRARRAVALATEDAAKEDAKALGGAGV